MPGCHRRPMDPTIRQVPFAILPVRFAILATSGLDPPAFLQFVVEFFEGALSNLDWLVVIPASLP